MSKTVSIPKMYLDAPMHSVTISGNEAFKEVTKVKLGFPGGSDSKESACRAGDPSVICGMGRSPGKGSGYPLQYSCLENPMDRGAWWATVLGVTELGITE